MCEKRHQLHKILNWCCWQNLHKSSPRTWLHPETVTWRNVGKVQKFSVIGHKSALIPVSFEDNPYDIVWWNWMETILLSLILINLKMQFDSRWALSSLSNEDLSHFTRYAVSRTEERQREELRKREEKIERWLHYYKDKNTGQRYGPTLVWNWRSSSPEMVSKMSLL